MALGALAAKAGWASRSTERSVWFVLDRPEDLGIAEAIAADFHGRFGRLNFFVTSATGMLAPAAPVLAAERPAQFSIALNLALRRLRARSVIAIGGESSFAKATLAAAPGMGADGFVWAAAAPLTDALRARVQASLRANPRGARMTGWGEAFARRAITRGLPLGLERLRCRKLADLDALRQALGGPETVLCLGSGPSSNEPAAVAAAEAADVVFRVKHRWLKEGAVKRADVAFTGTAETGHHLPRAILIAQDERTAARMAFERAWRGGARRLCFAVAEELVPDYATGLADGAKRTNGAAMLAVAAALAPKRLIVAGVDLYSHPDGAYPGGKEVINDYAPAHDALAERAHALAMLARQTTARGPDSLTVIGPLADIARAGGVPCRDAA